MDYEDQPTIGGYLQQIFHDGLQPTHLHCSPPNRRDWTQFTQDDVKYALKKLSTNKASGCDGLSDNVLKSFKDDEDVLAKLRTTFSTWFNKGKIPLYMKQALVTPLSKTSSNYPPYGQIRPIAVLPATFKLYEHLVLKELEDELS